MHISTIAIASLGQFMLTFAWPIKRELNEIMMCLTPFDRPQGFQTDGLRQPAQWIDGPDSVHWPNFTLRNNRLWYALTDDASYSGGSLQIPLWQDRKGCNGESDGWNSGIPFWAMNDFSSYNRLMLEQDPYIFPGHIHVRNLQGQGGACITYSTSRYMKIEQLFFNADLLAFAVQLNSSTVNSIASVQLQYANETVYSFDNTATPLNSLTLLLGPNAPWFPYQLYVNGYGPINFSVGLENVTVGRPVDTLLLVDSTWSSGGSTFTLRSAAIDTGTGNDNSDGAEAAIPYTFYARQQWNEDVSTSLNSSYTEPFVANYTSPPTAGLVRHVNSGVPRAPVSVHGVALEAGMSGGWFFGNGQDAGYHKLYNTTALQWAALVSPAFDWVAEQLPNYLDYDTCDNCNEGGIWDQWATTLANAGVGIGFVPGYPYDRPTPIPEIAFYGATMPDYSGPLYRDMSLAAQRFKAYPNMKGVSIGADNAGYVQYWNWAQNNPNRPYGEALEAFMAWRANARGLPYTQQPYNGSQILVPVAPSLGYSQTNEGVFRGANTSDMVSFLHDFDALYSSTYGYLAAALVEALGEQAVATTGSFGSSPGVGGNGGFPWATIPGREMFSSMSVAQSYDWNEQNSTLPCHNLALLDRIRSWGGQNKTLYALIDNFHNHLGRQNRLRANALVLTRGPASVGTPYLPPATRPDRWNDVYEAADWIHSRSGAYAGMRATGSVAILYVNEQANLRPPAGSGAGDPALFAGSHEGKTTEALFVIHAAGIPGILITPDEILRGLPSTARVLLLVGFTQYTNASDWHWATGNVAGNIIPSLQAFVAGGGSILVDTDSESSTTPDIFASIPVVKTGTQFRAYTTNTDADMTGVLIARNAANIAALQSVFQTLSVPPALATSSVPELWVIPSQTGDVRYITVLNQNNLTITSGGATDDIQPMPSAGITWNTNALAGQPIYDMRASAQVTVVAASSFNLTDYPFMLFGVPPAPVQSVSLSISPLPGSQGYYTATVAVFAGGKAITGVPLQLTVTHTVSGDSASVYAGSVASTNGTVGSTVVLPLTNADAPGAYNVTLVELMAGYSMHATITVGGGEDQSEHVSKRGVEYVQVGSTNVTIYNKDSVLAFLSAQRNTAVDRLKVALTPEQALDSTLGPAASALVSALTTYGRANVALATAAPANGTHGDGVISGLYPYNGPMRYPQWTISSGVGDLVLIGSAVAVPSTDPTSVLANPMILDLSRSHIQTKDLARLTLLSSSLRMRRRSGCC